MPSGFGPLDMHFGDVQQAQGLRNVDHQTFQALLISQQLMPFHCLEMQEAFTGHKG